MKRLLLASASPRRAALLAQCRIPYDIITVDNDSLENTLENTSPDEGAAPAALAERAAQSKLDHAARSVSETGAVLLCADTIVVVDGEVLGKPRDDADAQRMLRALGGRSHEVITGVALRDMDTHRAAVFHECTEVVFRRLSDAEIENYVKSGEPRDKAGAYGIQGLAGAFVTRVDGCYSNVVGLPLARLAEILKIQFDADVTDHWIS